MIRIILVCCLFLLHFYLPADSAAQTQKDTLVVCLGKAKPKSLDPSVSNTRQVLTLYHNWGDTLLYRDPEAREIIPGLAESYRILRNGNMELKLRKGVEFHNGEPFNAEAVKFSLDLLKKPESKVSRYLSNIKDVVLLNDHKIRIEVAKPIPTLKELIANVLFIYPPGYYRKAGKDEFGRHPVGTGPYRMVSNRGFMEMEFKKNADYFGGPKKQAHIPNLKVRIIKETIPQMEALMSGDLDLIRSGCVNPEQVPFLKQSDQVKLKSVNILRVYFLVMDARGRSGETPFTKKKVRVAVNHAINRQAIVQNAFNGYAHFSGSVLNPLHFGFEEDVAGYSYDPQKARLLLAEAGYPNGFDVDYYAINNESAAETILQNLYAVGIRAKPRWMMGRWDTLYKKFLKGEIPLAFMTWGSYSIFDASALVNHFFMAESAACYGTTPEINRLLHNAMASANPQARKKYLSRAQRLIAEEAFWVPICTVEALCAMQKNLLFQPAVDEIDRYFMARWR